MMSLRALFASVLCLAAAGCVSAPTSTPATPKFDSLRFAADAVRISGSDREIGMGRFRDGVLSTVQRLTGAAPDTVSRCPDAPQITIARYETGLQLAFRDDHLFAWLISERGWASVSGLRVGDQILDVPLDGVSYDAGTVERFAIESFSSDAAWIKGQTCLPTW